MTIKLIHPSDNHLAYLTYAPACPYCRRERVVCDCWALRLRGFTIVGPYCVLPLKWRGKRES